MSEAPEGPANMDTLTQVLGLVLQTCCDQLRPRAVCTLLQTCSGVRSALRQLQGGGCMHLEAPGAHARTLEQLEGLAAWLPAHAGLVHSLSIKTPVRGALATSTRPLQLAIAALQACAAAAAQGGAAPGLQLSSFSTDYASPVELLEALPVGSLTCLELSRARLASDPAAFAAALGTLSRLRLLSLECYTRHPWTAVGAALCGLTALTYLYLGAPAHASALQLLPRGLQQLDVRVASAPAGIDLSALTRLRELGLEISRDPDSTLDGSALPAQLTSLRLECNNQAVVEPLGVARLRQLRELELDSSTDDAAAVQQLGALPQLQGLTLVVWVEAGDAERRGSLAPPSTSAWPRLPQLRDLSVRMEAMDDAGWQELLASVSQLTSLTRLLLAGIMDDDCNPVYLGPFPVCQRLSGLTQLRMLYLDCVLQPEGSLVHLLPLTRLTSLDVVCGWDSDNLALAALAGRLTALHDLWVRLPDGEEFSLDPLLLCVLGSATQLRSLIFEGHAGISSTDLSALHPLTQLTCFEARLDDRDAPDHAALRAFVAAAPGLANYGLAVGVALGE